MAFLGWALIVLGIVFVIGLWGREVLLDWLRGIRRDG